MFKENKATVIFTDMFLFVKLKELLFEATSFLTVHSFSLSSAGLNLTSIIIGTFSR